MKTLAAQLSAARALTNVYDFLIPEPLHHL
jgi:hypothetical protein